MGLIQVVTQPFLSISLGRWALFGITSWVCYWLAVTIQRLWFHPLSKIPGPWFAAASYWYEFYQDVMLGGNYVKDYPLLHAKYGEYKIIGCNCILLAVLQEC